MDRLDEQKAGSPATAKWANEVVDELRRLKIVPGNGIRVTTTGSGTVVSLDIPPQAEGGESQEPNVDSCFPVMVSGHAEGVAFRGVSYRELDRNNSMNDRMFFPHVSPSSYYPIGCTVLAHRLETHSIASSSDDNG